MAKKTFDAIIFDLDGTLLDSLADISEAVNCALIDFGFPSHSLQSFKHMVGDGISDLIVKAIPKEFHSEKLVATIVEKVLINYKEFNYRKTTLYPGIDELLNKLTEMNVKLAILSNKHDNNTKQVVNKTLSGWRFDQIIGATNKDTLKPNPTNALLIADYWSISPENILLVGDSETDILTARNAKMTSVAVIWGYRTKVKLISYHPDYIIDKPIELLKLVLGK